jgi:hypothetical protein
MTLIAHVVVATSVAPKWILLAGTLFLLTGAVLQATIELAKYANMAAEMSVALAGSLAERALKRYDALGSNVRTLATGTAKVGERWKAFRGVIKQIFAFLLWPYVWPGVLVNLVRDAAHATSSVDGMKIDDLKAAGWRAAGWWLVVAGATLAFASAILDLLLA